MQNYTQLGDVLTLTAPGGGVVSGTAYQIGQLLVVATANVAAGLPFNGIVEGGVSLPKAAVALTEGAVAYWDNTAKVITNVPTANLRVGTIIAAAAGGDATCKVKLSGVSAPAGA